MGRVITVNLGGDAVFTVNLADEMEIHDPDAERHKVASDVAWWGMIAARARARAESFSNEAEHWKNAALKACTESDDKMAEWKAKAQANGHPTYRKMLLDVATANEAAGTAEAVHWAYVRKMDMLRAMISAENGTQRSSSGIGQVVPDGPKEPSATDSRLDRFKQKRKQPAEET